MSCRAAFANTFTYDVDHFDIFGNVVLSSNGKQILLSGEESRKTLYSIYSAPDFWEKVVKARQERDFDALLLLFAIWQDIANYRDRVHLMHEIFRGTIREPSQVESNEVESKPENSNVAVFESGEKIGEAEMTKKERPLQLCLRRMGADYYFLGYDFLTAHTALDAKTDHYLLNYSFLVWFRLKSVDCLDIIQWSKAPQNAIKRIKLMFSTLEATKWADVIIFTDLMSLRYKLPELECSMSDIEVLRKILPNSDESLQLDIAIRENNTGKIYELAQRHFYPAYYFASENYFANKEFDNAAYFMYLHWRHPANYWKCMMSPNPHSLRAFALPAIYAFSELLISAERYDDLISFARYVARILSKNSTMSEDVSVFKSYVENKTKGKTNETMDIREPSKYTLDKCGYFSIPEFELRYQRELSQLANAK